MLNIGNKDRDEELSPVTLLFLDRYNVEDPIFVADIARRLVAALRSGIRALVVHASDDAVDRITEAYGRSDLEPEETRELIERAIRMTNQSITRRLIDEGVPAVSIQGDQRGLLHMPATEAVYLGRTEWLERAIGMGSVPVVSLLAVTDDNHAVKAEAATAIEAITKGLSESWTVTLVCFTTNRKSGLFDDEGHRLETVSSEVLSSFDSVPSPLNDGTSKWQARHVVVTNSAGIAPDGTVTGTEII